MPRTRTSSSVPPRWAEKIDAVVSAVKGRADSREPDQHQIAKAYRLTPRDNMSLWAGPVSFYEVTDGTGTHMIVVMDHGDISKPAGSARCSCDIFTGGEICAHVLAVLADHPGKLT